MLTHRSRTVPCPPGIPIGVIIPTQVGILHYQLMVLTVLVEAPPLGHLVREARLGWGAAATVGSALAQSVCFRHAAAVGLFIVGFTRQHEAIVHLATLRGGTASGGSSSSSSSTVCARVCVCVCAFTFPVFNALIIDRCCQLTREKPSVSAGKRNRTLQKCEAACAQVCVRACA